MTTTSARPGPHTASRIRTSRSCSGARMATRSPRRRSAGTRPARTSDDFPLPDAPDTARKPERAIRASAAAMSASRPKNSSSSSTPNGCSPRYGQATLATAGASPRSSASSWRSTPSSSSVELSAGFHAEFVGEPLAGLADRGERVRLPAAPVERGGEQHPASLPERRLAHESLGVRDGCGVLAQAQSCFEPHLLQVHPHLVEPLGLHERRRPAGQVGVRDAAPERECAVGGVRGPRRVVVEVLASGCGESFEALRVDGLGVDAQRVRARRGLDGVAPDRGPHPADRRLQLLRPGLRQFVAPEGIGELVGRDRTARAEHQRREHRALPRAERGPLEGERAEDCHAHAPHCSPIPDDRQ